MTDELESQMAAIAECKKVYDSGLQHAATLPAGSHARLEELQKLEALSKRLSRALSSCKYQLRDVKDVDAHIGLERRLREHTNDAFFYDGQLNRLKEDKGNRSGGSGGTATSGEVEVGVEENEHTARELQQQAARVLDKSAAAVERTQRLAAEAEVIGTQITVELGRQREEIEQVDEQLNVLEEEIRRAQKEFVWFVRNASGDKCFLCLLCGVVTAVVFIVCYTIFKKK